MKLFIINLSEGFLRKKERLRNEENGRIVWKNVLLSKLVLASLNSLIDTFSDLLFCAFFQSS